MNLFYDWENYLIVIGWEQASLSLYLICSAVQMNACAFVTQVHSDVIEAGVYMNYE